MKKRRRVIGRTDPRHVLHEDGERLLVAVPQTAVILDDAFVTKVLQQLDLTLQSADLLVGDGKRSAGQTQQEQEVKVRTVPAHLTGLRTVGVKVDLLGGELPPRVHVVTQVDVTERPLTQELPPPPRHWSARSCQMKTHTRTQFSRLPTNTSMFLLIT